MIINMSDVNMFDSCLKIGRDIWDEWYKYKFCKWWKLVFFNFRKEKCVYSYILSKEYNFYGKKIMKYYLFIFIKIQKVG